MAKHHKHGAQHHGNLHHTHVEKHVADPHMHPSHKAALKAAGCPECYSPKGGYDMGSGNGKPGKSGETEESVYD